MEKSGSDDHLSRILRIKGELDRIKDLDLLLERLLLLVRSEANADAGTVYIKEGKRLAFKYAQNDTFQAKLKPGEKLIYTFFKIPIDDKSISGYVAKHETILNIPDMYNIDPKASYSFNPEFDEKTGYKTVSSFTFPLINTEGELLGVMQLLNAKSKDGKGFIPFPEEEEQFFELLASQGSEAIQRAQTTRNFLETIAGFAGLRDPKETSQHVNRVGAYSTEIYEAWARRRGTDQKELEKTKDTLRMAAMLHDVGKVGISDIILKKPGGFEDDERRVMESHTWVGARQFRNKADLDLIAREVSLRHHENWDGSGYPGKIGNLREADKYIKDVKERPEGLKGEEIPLFARIVSIADVYDALSFKRVYKEPWPEEKVLEAIRSESGTKFDPEIVNIFFDILPTMRNIRERYPDEAEEENSD